MVFQMCECAVSGSIKQKRSSAKMMCLRYFFSELDERQLANPPR